MFFDFIHSITALRSYAESAYYSEAKIENAKRKALAEKRKQEIQQLKVKKDGKNQ